MLLAITAFAAVLLLFPWWTASRWWYFFSHHQLRLFRFCHSVESLVCRQFSSTSKTKIFSINYTMLNIGGPSARHSARCWSCRASICPLAGRYLLCVSHVFHSNLGKAREKIIATETGSVWSPKVLLQIRHCCGLPALAFWLLLLVAHCFMHFTICDGDC